MGGSGGGSGFTVTSTSIRERVREARDGADQAAFESEVNSYLAEKLKEFNSRDTNLVKSRLEEILGVLGEKVEDSLQTLFGGSVAKHTYVDGLSDVDTLLVVDDKKLGAQAPKDILSELESTAKQLVKQGHVESVQAGTLALTVTYTDGQEIQLLPTIKSANSLKVPSWDGSSWSPIKPESFQKGLTKRNEEMSGRLIPTIKLLKALFENKLPEKQRPSGYHVESMAVSLFRGYEGPKTPLAMVKHFVDRAPDAVLSPVNDKTGQSTHADDYLGQGGSSARKRMSQVLNSLKSQLENAATARQADMLKEMFNNDF
jgi:hypothetical protein